MPKLYQPKLTTINVESLRLRSYIGFIDWEKEKLQDVVISFSFKYDSSLASESDDVQYAVDYKKLTKEIIALVDNQSFHLIETLAEEIYQHIVSSGPLIQDVEVCVEKPHALRFADNVKTSISSKDRLNTVIVSMGSNIDAEINFEKALVEMQKLGFITQRSAFEFTKALKHKDQADFLNGAIILQTSLSFTTLKLHLKQIEMILGRVRNENKNAPRPMDLDIATFNGFIIDEDISEFPFLENFVNLWNPIKINQIK